MHVTLLTVGEYPTEGGLHASQVLPFAAHLQKIDIIVHWVAFLPLEMRLRDLVFSKGSILAKMRKLTAEQGIEFTTILFPITIIRAYSYFFGPVLVYFAGISFAALLQRRLVSAGPHIIHCRSYFATAVALEAKKRITDLLVSFDMRSLLPAEIPLMFPVIGASFYGWLKRWESFLLNKSDFSFLPSKRGIRMLEFEGIKRSPAHVNIAGFEGVPDYEQNIMPSIKRVVGYVGGFGPWQSILVLEKVFNELSRNVQGCSFNVVTASKVSFNVEVNVLSLPHNEVKNAINEMMAVVVPGVEVLDGHFNTVVSSYLFSTKAAEALSLGVPLIVNNQISELADYVRSNGCGLVFSMGNGLPQFEGVSLDQLNDMGLWMEMRKAASRCAPEFMRHNVFAKYLLAWNGTLSTKISSVEE